LDARLDAAERSVLSGRAKASAAQARRDVRLTHVSSEMVERSTVAWCQAQQRRVEQHAASASSRRDDLERRSAQCAEKFHFSAS
jgi:hypothetical protein